MGELTSPLYAGPVDRWDHGNSLYVRFYGAANLLSLTEGQVLGGAGAIAVKTARRRLGGAAVPTATLTGQNSYQLSKLLRGQLGTEGAMRNPVRPAPVSSCSMRPLTPLDINLDNRRSTRTSATARAYTR